MKIINITAFLLLLSIAVSAQSSRDPAELTLKDINNHPLSLSRYKGKVVLVNFWATWCIPCRSEIPYLIKIQRKYRNQNLQIIGVTFPPDKLSEVRQFVRKLRVNYPVARGTEETKAHFTQSKTLPITVVIDREGIVRDVIEGIMYADEFDQKVKPHLSHSAPLD